MKVQMLRMFFSVAILTLISACASSVPLESTDRDTAMKQFVKPEDGANVYIVQSGGVMTQHRINFQIVLDSKLVAIMSGYTYSVHRLAAGSHTLLVASPENQELLEFSANNGENLFIGVGSHGGWTQMRTSNVRMLSETDGKEAVLDARLSRSVSSR